VVLPGIQGIGSNMWACILNIKLLYFVWFDQLNFSFRNRHYLWDTLSIMALQPFAEPWPRLQFLNLYTISKTPWTGDKPVARPLPTHRTTQTQNKRTHTSMLRVVFERKSTVFARAKTVHALDRAATVIGKEFEVLTAVGIKSSISVHRGVISKMTKLFKIPLKFLYLFLGFFSSQLDQL
jgi:hypothetical protein